MVHESDRLSGKTHVATLSSPGSPLRYEFNATVRLYLVWIGSCRFGGIMEQGDGLVFAYLNNAPRLAGLPSYWYVESLEAARRELEQSYEQQKKSPTWERR